MQGCSQPPGDLRRRYLCFHDGSNVQPKVRRGPREFHSQQSRRRRLHCLGIHDQAPQDLDDVWADGMTVGPWLDWVGQLLSLLCGGAWHICWLILLLGLFLPSLA